jgi:hypothetical protein
MIDHEIEAIMREAEAARARTGVLKAEWTLMNDPERLGALAAKFLSLKTTTPGQFTTMADLDARLPPVRPPDQPAAGSTDEDAPAEPPKPAEIAAAPHPAAPAATPAPAAPAAPAAIAQAKPAPVKARPVQVAAQSAPLAAPPGQAVSLLGRPVSYAPPAPAPSPYSPTPYSPPPYSPPAPPRVAAASAPTPAPAPPIVGSSLGMAWRPHD